MCMAIGVLCADAGTWSSEGIHIEETSDSGTKIMARCKGLTMEALSAESLTVQALGAIKTAYCKIVKKAESKRLVGVTADVGYLWLKHSQAVRLAIGADVPVYLSPLLQFPMISACFKNFESTCLITWGSTEDWESRKADLMSSYRLNLATEQQLIVCGVPGEEPKWKKYMDWDATPEDAEALGKELLKLVRERIRRHEKDNEGNPKHDKLVKAIIVTARLSQYTDMLRSKLRLPCFDEGTMLRFFRNASGVSHHDDINILARLSDRLRGRDALHIFGKKQCPTQKIGLIRLEYEYPPALGDPDHPGTFGFQIVSKIVDGLTFERAQDGDISDDILQNMASAIHWLQAQGVVGITGNCGFMMHYQCFARFVACIPCFMSSLIQCATLEAAVLPHERVLILTANSSTLEPGKDKLLRQSGISINESDIFMIRGLQDLPGFEAVANAEKVDTIKVMNNISERVKELIDLQEKEENPIRLILMECTELPHYSGKLREVTGLPVFDLVTCVNFFFEATHQVDWNTHSFSPHNEDFWQKNFSKFGHNEQ